MKYWNNKGRNDLEAVILERLKSIKKEEAAILNTIRTNSYRCSSQGLFQAYHHQEYIKHQYAVVAFMLKRIMTECL